MPWEQEVLKFMDKETQTEYPVTKPGLQNHYSVNKP